MHLDRRGVPESHFLAILLELCKQGKLRYQIPSVGTGILMGSGIALGLISD
jgi:hypothetical protein